MTPEEQEHQKLKDELRATVEAEFEKRWSEVKATYFNGLPASYVNQIYCFCRVFYVDGYAEGGQRAALEAKAVISRIIQKSVEKAKAQGQ